MAYTKEFVTKLIRTTHKVDFRPEIRAYDLIQELNRVPLNAKLFDYEEDGDLITLIFMEEKEEL